MYLSHHAIWAQDLVQELRQKGFSQAQIVESTGISMKSLQGKRPTLSFDKLATLFEHAAALTDDDLLGFRLGQGREFRRGGLVIFLGISSPTVRTLLLNLGRYQRIMGDAVRIDTSRLDKDGTVEWGYKVPQAVTRRQYLEFTATHVVTMIRQLTARDFQLEKLELRYHRSSNVEAFAQYFGCPVEFGTRDNRMYLKKNDLELHLRTADVYLYEILKDCCEAALKNKKTVKTPMIVAVERELAHGRVSQNSVAAAMAMSTRTLTRRLKAEGTTFFKVVEGYREALSKSLIESTDLQMTEIAFLAGYSDLSSFSTAFRKWTGESPRHYRQASPSVP